MIGPNFSTLALSPWLKSRQFGSTTPLVQYSLQHEVLARACGHLRGIRGVVSAGLW